MRCVSILGLFAIVGACERDRPPPAPGPDGPVLDAGTFGPGLPPRRRDGGRVEPERDGAATIDAATRDAGGAASPTVDGVLSPGEWSGALETTSGEPPLASGPFAGDQLRTLRVIRTSTRLFVAIEGTLSSGNAYLMYVDNHRGGVEGLASPTPLADFAGALDRALSKELVTPADVRVDLAWGALDTNRRAIERDDRMGWRDVGTDPSVFREIDEVDAPTACASPGTCETSIPLVTLGSAAEADIVLFVRLGGGESAALSSQTLPMDDPATPEYVTHVLEVPAP